MTDSGLLLRALVVDDERPAREIVHELLSGDPEIEVVGECRNGKEALEAIRDHRPDLVFLDVQMPELDGFGVLAQLDPSEIPIVVFVTAYDDYAVRAFEVHALDYLLKPFDDQRFAEALERAKASYRRREMEAIGHKLVRLVQDHHDRKEPAADGGLDRLMIKSSGRVSFVKTDEIDWIEAADYYVRVHAGGKRHLLRESLSSLETRLDSERFVRVHRSAIVNLDRASEIRPLFKGSYLLILQDGTRLKLSRTRRAELESRLAKSRSARQSR